MLHRITGRAVKCGPSAISAIAGVPTHEAAAVIRRLFDRPSVNGVHTDELAAALEEFGWAPDYAFRHPKYRQRRYARREEVWDRIFADVPFEVRAITLGTFLDAAPSGAWAIADERSFRGVCGRFRRRLRRLVLPQARLLVPRHSQTMTASPSGAFARPSGSRASPGATPARRSADHAPGHRDHGLQDRRAFRRREGSCPRLVSGVLPRLRMVRLRL